MRTENAVHATQTVPMGKNLHFPEPILDIQYNQHLSPTLAKPFLTGNTGCPTEVLTFSPINFKLGKKFSTFTF